MLTPKREAAHGEGCPCGECCGHGCPASGEIDRLRAENEALREADSAAADVLAWVSENRPKVMREVPTPLYQELLRQSARWREVAK